MKELTPEDLAQIKKRTYVVVALMLLIATAFIFRPASYLPYKGYILYHSYFADVMLPFGFYFLISLNEKTFPWLRKWWLKVLIIFAGATTSEILQYFDIYAFGVTFDPLDIVAYGTGAMLAAGVDQLVFPKVFGFWK
ncbi:MAG: hypothetical protein ABFS32_05855 [Bacteroidota bacterium]